MGDSEATPAVEKMSNSVLIKRFPDNYTLMGPPIMVKDLDDAADMLAQNKWMLPWLAAKIKRALQEGETFSYVQRTSENWKGRPDGVVAEYRIASEKEVLDYVDTAQFASVTGHAVSRRAQEKGYVLHYHEGPELIEKYDALPKQARTILDLLNAAGRENFTEASIEVILSQNTAALNTKQPPMKIFGFYRRRFIDDGHLEEVE